MSQAWSFITNIEITFNITLPPCLTPEATQEEKFAKKKILSFSLSRKNNFICCVKSKYYHVIGNIIKEEAGESPDKCQI